MISFSRKTMVIKYEYVIGGLNIARESYAIGRPMMRPTYYIGYPSHHGITYDEKKLFTRHGEGLISNSRRKLSLVLRVSRRFKNVNTLLRQNKTNVLEPIYARILLFSMEHMTKLRRFNVGFCIIYVGKVLLNIIAAACYE